MTVNRMQSSVDNTPFSATEPSTPQRATVPQPQPAKLKKTSPKSRKPASIFKFKQPPELPCSMAGCPDPKTHTTSRCKACSVPAHGNCLHDRILCTTCYNARMEQHKDALKAKRQKAKTPAPPPAATKPRIAAGLVKQLQPQGSVVQSLYIQ